MLAWQHVSFYTDINNNLYDLTLMKIDFLDEVSSHDKCNLIPKET